MRKIILAAIDEHLAIGNQNRLPWQGLQRGDMKRFVATTRGFPVIVGRKTYESFPKRPLPNRTNIVVTRRGVSFGPGTFTAASCETAVSFAEQEGKDRVFIIGGSEIYREMMPLVDELDMTLIHHRFEADTFFPPIDMKYWEEISRESHPADAENRHPYSFLRFSRR